MSKADIEFRFLVNEDTKHAKCAGGYWHPLGTLQFRWHDTLWYEEPEWSDWEDVPVVDERTKPDKIDADDLSW
jgi:hypothetical protein